MLYVQLLTDYSFVTPRCPIGFITKVEATREEFESCSSADSLIVMDDKTGKQLISAHADDFRIIGETSEESESLIMGEKIALSDKVEQSEAVIIFHSHENMAIRDYYIVDSFNNLDVLDYLKGHVGNAPEDGCKTLYAGLVNEIATECRKIQLHTMYHGSRQCYIWISTPNNSFEYGTLVSINQMKEVINKFREIVRKLEDE